MRLLTERPFVSDLSPLPHLRLIPAASLREPDMRVLAIRGIVLALSAAAPATAAAMGSEYATAAYRGLAAWIDIYDHGPWERPERTVRSLARRGVGTLFVQTSNYRQRQALHRPAVLSRLLAAADREGVQTVAWYLPGFDRPRRDWRRVKAGVSYVNSAGQSLRRLRAGHRGHRRATGGCNVRAGQQGSPVRSPLSG
jgi:hypothetical protein